MTKMKYEVCVSADIKENGRSDIEIKYPENQQKISFQLSAHILASGISLLIRLCEKESGMKDHELMKEIIDHLEMEFTSTRSFDDAKIHYKSNGEVSI
jgi:hypothetical protein